MTRLLNANFARLFKSRLFWLCAAASVALGLFEIIQEAITMKEVKHVLNPESVLMNNNTLFGIFSMFIITAIFVGIFVGVEHGGALRNKIISGKRRVSVYAANLLTCISGVLIFQILYAAAILLTGIILGGKFILSFETIAVYQLIYFISLIGLCALFTALAMLIPQKLAGAIVALVLVIVLYFVDTSVSVALDRVGGYATNGPDGEVIFIEGPGIPESVLNFLHKINPLGQGLIVRENFFYTQKYTDYKLSGYDYQAEIPPVPTDILPYSLGVIAVPTIVGILVFRKKNLK